MQPKSVLIDCGGTLVEELSFDLRRRDEWVLARAACNPSQITINQVLERATNINNEVAARRDEFRLETPWPMLTRLIYDFSDIQFESDRADPELGFWKASAETRPMPGAIDALDAFQRSDIPTGVATLDGESTKRRDGESVTSLAT